MTEREHFDSKGAPRVSRNYRLVVRNSGSATASNVRVALRTLEEGSHLPRPIDQGEGAFSIGPDRKLSWALAPSMASARIFEVLMTWEQDGKKVTESQHVSLHPVTTRPG